VPSNPIIFDYNTPDSDPHKIPVKRINPYLVDAPDILLPNRTHPVSKVPDMDVGCQPIDDGNYLFTQQEYEQFILKEPQSTPYFHRWVGSDEFINNTIRYCLWLGNCPPDELRKMPEVLKRVDAVKQFRLKSKREQTLKMANQPAKFYLESIPTGTYVVVPETSSENRNYIPIGFLNQEYFCSNAVRMIPNATLYHFGILTSSMHMAWVRYVCGRLESRYRYSAGIVYNNFPWPTPTEKQMKAIEKAAQGVLDARTLYPKSSLADLYDPLTMPKELVKAHQDLDAEVERAYGKRFSSDADRVAFLFGEYLRLTASSP